jgi:hypothetical protein
MSLGDELVQVSGLDGTAGFGTLYQAPDGALYEVPRTAPTDELSELSEEEVTALMEPGYLGEVRQAPDGALYQWLEESDGLGNPVGFWWALPALKSALPLVAGRLPQLVRRARPFLRQFRPQVRQVLRQVAPQAVQYLPPIPPATASPVANPLSHYGAYSALAEDEYLRGFTEDELAEEELAEDELAEDEYLRGLAEEELAEEELAEEELAEEELAEEELAEEELAEEELAEEELAEDELAEDELAEDELAEDELAEDELAEDELAEDELAEDEYMQGMDRYVRHRENMGLEAYVPTRRPRTRWFVAPTQPPDLWRPLW